MTCSHGCCLRPLPVVSGLGTTKNSPAGTLTAGATAVTPAIDATAAAHLTASPIAAPRVVWLSALGSGASAPQASPATRLLLRVALGAQKLTDRANADTILLADGTPRVTAGKAAAPGLYFVGFTPTLTGALREKGVESPPPRTPQRTSQGAGWRRE